MDKANVKMWAFFLVIVMITSTFVGFSAMAWGPTDVTPISSDRIKLTSADFNGKQPVNNNLFDKDKLNERNTGPAPLSPPPEPETEGTWAYDFDSDTVNQWPSIPPWNYGATPAGQTSSFGVDDFEDDVVGSKPDYPPWATVDGNIIVGHWTEDFEGFTATQDLTGGAISGDLGYFSHFVGAATLTAEVPPAGAPPGTIIPDYNTGGLCAYFTDPTGGSYWGPAGIGDTTYGFAGGWVYMNTLARFDIVLYDSAGGTRSEVALLNDGSLFHWPGGVPTPIAGATYATNEWHEVYIEYDETPSTYSVWWDGVEYAAGSAFLTNGNIDSLIWFGDVGDDVYVDNFFHFEPPVGLTHVVDVVNSEAHSGVQSVWIDQNGEAAPDLATMTTTFDPPMAGTGTWDYWFRTDAAVADTNGAVAELLDQLDGSVIQIQAAGGNFQYNDGGTWTDALVGFAADTWYHFTVNFDTVAKTFTLDIDGAPSGGGAFARECGTITSLRYRGSGGTQSEHYIDDVNVICNGADANITVSNMVSNSAPNSLRVQEYNAVDFCYAGADGLGVGIGAVGTFSFWFYNSDSGGGQRLVMGDVNGGNAMNYIALGINLATLEANPGVVQMVNNDGAGLWVVDGPTYNANEWHQITIEYNCDNNSISGSTGSYFYSWDGGPLNGPYGMIDPLTFFDFLTIYGGSPETWGDFFYDDFSLSVNVLPGAPTNCWCEVPAPTGVEVFDNYTTDQDNPVYGYVTGTEANTHGAGTEDIREVATNDVPTWANYTVDQDNPVEGVVTNDYTNVDEIFPPDGLTEEITEVIGDSGSTWIDYSTDQDNPWNGTVTGTEVNTHTIDATTQDIQEILNGGNIWLNYSTDLDIPDHGTVTGTHVLTQVLDGSTQEILEVAMSEPSGLVYYNDRALFDTDAGPLPIEDFEESSILPGQGAPFDGPLDEFTSNAYFNTGDILPGIRLQEVPPHPPIGMGTAGAGWWGAPSKTVFTSFFVESMRMTFDDPAYPVHCIGMDLQSYSNPCTPTIEIYGIGGILIDTVTCSADNVGIFWGVISEEQIEYILINDTANTDGGDNIAFGYGQWGNSAEHQWRTDPVRANATALQLVVNARTNTGADDNFTFEYSEDGIAWTSTGISVDSDVMTEYSFSLPLWTAGAPLYLRAKDGYNDPADIFMDTLYIDEIRVEYYNDRPFWHTLEHRWRTQSILVGGDNLTLFVTAATNAASDDTFTFGYATAAGGPYTKTTLTVNSGIMTTYAVEIPINLTGQIYIRVMDDNTWADPTQADTLFIDEIRIERQVGMSLQHVWRTGSVSANTLILELFVTARTNTGSDDTFTFGYSTSQTGPFTPTTIVVNSDVMTTYRFIPPVLTGVFYLNVIDDNTMDTALMDTIIIDTITLEAAISTATITNLVATADNPDHGTVTGTYVLTTSIPPDGSAQQIDEIELATLKAPTPPASMGANPVGPMSHERIRPADMILAQPTAFASAVSMAFDYLQDTSSLVATSGGNHPLAAGGNSPLAPPPGPNTRAVVLAPPPGPSTRAVVLAEDFSTPWVLDADGDYLAPPGWDVDGLCVGESAPFSTHYWSQFNDAEIGFPTSNSTPEAAGLWWSNGAVGSPPDGSQDEWLITPSLDLSGYMNTRLFFNGIYTMPSYGSTATAHDYLWASTDGGLSWDPLGDMVHDAVFEIPGVTGGPGGAGFCWYEMYLPGATMLPIDLSAYDFMPDVKIAWNYISTDGAPPRGIFCIDDVHIDGEPAGNSLSHNWTMEPQPADSTTRRLYVNARTDAATDEGFKFGWSQNPGGPYTPVITVPGYSDTFATYSATLPTSFSGPLYVNVIDSNGFDFDPVTESSVFVDAIWVFNDNTVQPLWDLEHRWRTEPIAVGAQTLDLHVTARTNTGADDTFTFGYATALGGPYTPVITVNSDVMTTYTSMLPYYMSGPIYLNVVDDLADWGQPGYASSIDTVYVENITIEYYSPGGTLVQEFVINDRFGHGNVTGTYVMTQSLPPDGVEQEIEEVNVTIYPPDLPSSASEPSPFGPGPGPQPSAQVYYTTRAAFDADAGPLPIEDFEASSAAPGSIESIPVPLDEFSANPLFNPGDILPGIQFTDNPPTPADGIAVAGAGFMGNPSINIVANWFPNTFDIIFPNNDVYAVGMDLVNYVAPEAVTIEVYTTGDVLLDSTISPSDNAGVFWGVISDELITRINIYAPLGTAEGCDNIAFGEPTKKAHSIAHAWEMDLLPNMLTRTLHMNAHTNVGSNDEFTIGYVTSLADLADSDTWVPLFNVSSVIPTDYSALVPVDFTGETYVIAWDSNEQDLTPGEEDTLYVDTIYIQSFESAGSTSVDIHWNLSYDDFVGTWGNNYTVDQDNSFEGTVTNDYTNINEIFPLDGLTEDIQETPIGLAGSFSDNYTVTSDIDVEGNRVGTYQDIDEIDPPDGLTEDIQEVVGAASGGNAIANAIGAGDTTGDAIADIQADDAAIPPPGSVILGDGVYTVLRGETGFWDGFDTTGMSGVVTGAVLHLQYGTEGGYGGTNFVQYALDGQPLADTTIQPVDTGDGWSADETFDLLAAIPGLTLPQINTLDIEFTNNDGPPNDDLSFDYMYVEVTTGGGAYSLEHKWTTEALAAGPNSRDLFVRGSYNTGSDDTFSIEYSTDDIVYLPTGLTINSDVMTTYSVALPLALSGSIYLRVVDDNTGDAAQQDTVYIDLIRIEDWIPSSGDIYVDFLTDLDIPDHGAVTGTHVETHVLDGSTQEILEVGYDFGPGPQPPAQVYYTTRAAFDVDAGPLPIEDFEESTIGAGGIGSFLAPLDETTNNAYFNPGDILPGIRIEDYPIGGGASLVTLGAGFNGNPTKTVASDAFGDSLNLIFDDPAIPVYCVGIDLQSYWDPDTPIIRIYGLGGVLLDTVIAASDNTGIFWGVISDEQIERINIYSAGETDGGDNIAFGEGMRGNTLEHRWRIEPDPGATTLTLIVDACTNTGSDDNFIFEYSEDGIAWNPTGITVNTDVMTEYSFGLPLVSAPLYVRAIDDYKEDKVLNDTLYIDLIRVEWYFDVIPQNSLDHRWRTEVIGPLAHSITLNITARTNTGADDTFSFYYKDTLGEISAAYTPTGITVNSDVMTTYSATLPQSLEGGVFYIQVKDDNEADLASPDTIYIDAITLEYHGYITGSGENDIVAYNIYRADEEHGDDITGPYEFIGSSPPFMNTYKDPGEGLDLVNQAWYYVEALDVSGQVNASGYFSKLNYAPVTSNVLADWVSPKLIISPFTPSVTITADAFDDSSNYEAIPKMNYSEMFVDVDPGEGNGFPMAPVDGFWGNDTTEPITGTLDTSTWNVGVYEVYVRTAEDHTLGAMGSWVFGEPSNVTIEVIDGPPVANAGPDQLVPQHTLVTFDGSLSTDDAGITNYWWNFTDVVPVTLTTVAPTYTFDNEGIYTVTLTVMDTLGQTNSDIMEVNVTDGDPPVAEAGPDQQVTPGDTVAFDGTASYDPGHLGEPIIDGIVNWTWTFDDGTGPQTNWGPNPTHQFNIPGVYMVTLTVTDNAPVPPAAAPYTDTDTMNVTVVEIFNINITPAAGSDDWILVSFPNQASGNPLTTIVDGLDEGTGLVTWDIVQTYNSTLGGWLTTSTFKPASLNNFNYVDNFMAFWIHITDYGDGNLTITGALAISGEQAVIPLKTGWNLVGYPFPNTQEMFNTIGTLFSLDADVETYDSADPYRLKIVDVWTEWHDPGGGYWVHVAFDEDLWMWNP